jgi:hypothetical protein
MSCRCVRADDSNQLQRPPPLPLPSQRCAQYALPARSRQDTGARAEAAEAEPALHPHTAQEVVPDEFDLSAEDLEDMDMF